MNQDPSRNARLTVVVAAFDEADVLPTLHARIASTLDAMLNDGVDGRVLYVEIGRAHV